MPLKRPFSVTLLVWLVLSLSAWGAVRLLGSLRWWSLLSEFGAQLSPLYLFITGTGWILAGGVLFWSMWTGKAWAYWAIPISLFTWLAEYWIERVFFESSRANLTFAVGLSVFLLIAIITSVFNRYTRDFLTRSEEYEQTDEHQTPA